MNCEDARNRIDAAFDGGGMLDAETDAHLSGCTACHAYSEELAALSAALDVLPGADTPPGLEARTAATMQDTWKRQRRLRWIVPSIAAAAVLVAGLLFPVRLEGVVEDLPLAGIDLSAMRLSDYGAWTAAAESGVAELEMPAFQDWAASLMSRAGYAVEACQAWFQRTAGNSIWLSNPVLFAATALLLLAKGVMIRRFRGGNG